MGIATVPQSRVASEALSRLAPVATQCSDDASERQHKFAQTRCTAQP